MPINPLYPIRDFSGYNVIGLEGLQFDGNASLGNLNIDNLLVDDDFISLNNVIVLSDTSNISIIDNDTLLGKGLKNNSLGVETIFTSQANRGVSGTTSNNDYTLISNDIDRILIKADGNVGIGNSNPVDTLSVEGNIYSNNIASLTNSVNNLTGNVSNLQTRMNKVEGNIATLKGNVSSLTTRVADTEANIDLLFTLEGNLDANISAITTRLANIEAEIDTGNLSTLKFLDGNTFINTNLGLGTPTPTSKLQVIGNASVSGSITSNSVNTSGITLTPTTTELNIGSSTTLQNKLNVFSTTEQDKFIRFRLGGGTPTGRAGLQFSDFDTNSFYQFAEPNRLTFNYASGNPTNFGDRGTPIMVLDNNSNVGIGTTAPTGKFQVRTDTGNASVIDNSCDGAPGFQGISNTQGAVKSFYGSSSFIPGGSACLGSVSNHPTLIGTNNIERMRILTNGDVGIGTSSPNQKLQVNGNINITGDYLINGAPIAASKWLQSGNNIFYNDGNVGIGNSNPLDRLSVNGNIFSNNIVNIENNLSQLNGNVSILQSNVSVLESNVSVLQTNLNNASGNITLIQNEINTGNLSTIQVSGGNTIFESGNLGIGTTAPTQRLQVAGQILCDRILFDDTERVKIGSGSGLTNQGTRSIAIGLLAGQGNVDMGQGEDCVAIGREAGRFGQNNRSISIGQIAGKFNQGTNAVAIGREAGQGNVDVGQGGAAVAIGSSAGRFAQGDNSIAIGLQAALGTDGVVGQGSNSIAIGTNSGRNRQGTNSVAIGNSAGLGNVDVGQGINSVAIGTEAGRFGQDEFAVAIGRFAGRENQGNRSVAVGTNAGRENQKINAVAIGGSTGEINQGINSVAIGRRAGFENQADNSIVLNATGEILNNTTASSFVVKPIRAATTGNFEVMGYNETTGEIIRSGSLTGNLGIGTSSPSSKLDVVGSIRSTNNLFLTSSITSSAFTTTNGDYLSIEAFDLANVNKKPIVLNPFGGNVGIGTTSPSNKLDVRTPNNSYGIEHSTSVVRGATFISTASNREFQIGTITNHGMGFYTNNQTPQMVLTKDGNVGIGTTSPNQKLTVVGNARITDGLTLFKTVGQPNLIFESDQGITGHIRAEGFPTEGNAAIFFSSNIALGWQSKRRIIANQDNNNNNRQGFEFDAATKNLILFSTSSAGGGDIVFKAQAVVGAGQAEAFYGAPRMIIQGFDGFVGIGTTNITHQLTLGLDSAFKPTTNTWTTTSDTRLKENIETANIDRCYDIVSELDLKYYKWKENHFPNEQDKHKLGWLADDVEKVFPKAITTHNWKSNGGEMIEDLKLLNADQIYAVMYGAIKKLIERVETLENKISLLINGTT